ncbi:hypothetical protein [Flavisolibacter ginsenosidimutans]|uniref:Uncharacterized protein n=1 Tax=Flavisolibacter ginsenosidimutans TaxID=661481 RepID=A0A5B8UN41_9BACT|nr:hypothetical protein [Flavisolibacter ginsenosidimutans]QEC57998.1 hypothetical protein FSB75_19490 [Flavisolibacter ginsenosidimutans]
MSSKITQEKYDLVKIERLKHYLESAAEKGRPKFYEVFVDNLKAVDKTSDPEAFDEYLVYMGEDTRLVKVLIYTSTESCPRNDKFLFTVTSSEKEREEKRRGELSGIEVEEKIHAVVQQEREKMNTELLRKELQETKEDLEEAESYIEELEKKLVEARNTKAVQKESLGEVVSLALESIVRRNTHLLSGIPMIGQGLAGVVEQDNKRLEETALHSPEAIKERNVTFTKLSPEESASSKSKPPSVSTEDQQTLAYFNSLRQTFTESELLQVLDIIALLSEDKDNIASVVDLLQREDDSEESDAAAFTPSQQGANF